MNRFKQGLARLRANWMYILQAGLAAGLSFWVGRDVFGHEEPFFAPMATVIVLSTTGGERFRRSVELVLGVSLGVGMGDLLISLVGSGTWQIAVAVAASIALGTFVDKGVLVANQASFAAVLIATILPPGTSGGFDRMLDALIGGVVGLAVISLFPESPLRSGRQEIAKVLGLTGDVLGRVATALKARDADALAQALTAARGSQAGINNMIAAAQFGKETITVSPLLWGQRRRIKSMLRVLNPVDNAMRDTRVLARKALVLTEDHETASPAQIELITKLAGVATGLSDLYYGKGEVNESQEIPKLVATLRDIAGAADLSVAEGGGLSAHAVLAQTRSLVVDFMQICGLSRRSAIEALVPIAEDPAHIEELWNDGE
ncbi:FUSC family protein [Corynebacterium sp. SCR221107]|uniref:FUSC family protein n=1 Tax=Corynebacterium sp. SCR221107 TaxID=3017361 RepID=UPI0022EC2FEF|nr:FUSC family protein [Corynebacterium sp. SCR221107]WBT08476.1 FUSC family protein [Corynebacterium sp. SCR221107]